MRKEEVEVVLGGGDAGPIEPYLRMVATEVRSPLRALGMCLLRMEEATPPLRALLARAADGEELSEDESTLLFRGVYILGGGRDTQSCQTLLRLLRRPTVELDDLLGDAITQDMSRIVAGVFDGDADALFGMIANRSVDQYVREALLNAAGFLTWHGVVDRDRMLGLLEKFDEERLAADEDAAWAGWMMAIALLGLRDMASRVYRAFDDGRLLDQVLGRAEFEDMLASAERDPDDVTRFEEFRIGYIDDIADALAWSDYREPDGDDGSFDEDIFGRGDLDTLWTPTEPVRNPWRHIGRNDPCPCGSGKKAKKCCLANGG